MIAGILIIFPFPLYSRPRACRQTHCPRTVVPFDDRTDHRNRCSRGPSGRCIVGYAGDRRVAQPKNRAVDIFVQDTDDDRFRCNTRIVGRKRAGRSVVLVELQRGNSTGTTRGFAALAGCKINDSSHSGSGRRRSVPRCPPLAHFLLLFFS